MRRFQREESGNFLIITALAAPVLIGMAGLGTEAGLWFTAHRVIQGAADSGAATGATAYYNRTSANVSLEAQAVIAPGFVNGVNGVTVTVNRPPQSGTHMTTASAVEVIIAQTRNRLFSALFSSQPLTISARAVAVATGGKGCVLALDPSVGPSAQLTGSAQVNLNGCSLIDNSGAANAVSVGGSSHLTALEVDAVGGVTGTSGITTTQGILTNQPSGTDPYAGRSYPSYSGCTQNGYSTSSTPPPLNPGVYCNGFKLTGSANVTLNPGTYYFDRGSFDIGAQATLTGTGVTLVFTSSTGSNYATATINGGATVNLSAPTSGLLEGIVMFGDRNMPTGTSFSFDGGGTQALTGAVYLPNAAVDYKGGANSTTGCTQLVARTVKFSGNANFSLNCIGSGILPLGSGTARLVE